MADAKISALTELSATPATRRSGREYFTASKSGYQLKKSEFSGRGIKIKAKICYD